MSSTNRSIVYDLREYVADNRNRKNILEVRTSVGDTNGYVDQSSFVIPSGKSKTLSNLPQCLAITIYSQQPVLVVGTVSGNPSSSSFTDQTLLSLTTGMDNVTITNNTLENTSVTVIRLSKSETDFSILRRLLTFTSLSRIAPIGASVTDLSKVEVQDITLAPLTNDQVTAPSLSAGQKFRICDSDGTPNPTGAYLMYLNDIVTQQNFSGTLQVWFAERA